MQATAEKAIKGETDILNVTVELADGLATIKGKVGDDTAKAKAEQLTKIEGIESLKNEVIVEAPPPVAFVDDLTLKNRIEDVLKEKNIKDVSVKVRDGAVTLSGSVAKSKLLEVITAAREAKPRLYS